MRCAAGESKHSGQKVMESILCCTQYQQRATHCGRGRMESFSRRPLAIGTMSRPATIRHRRYLLKLRHQAFPHVLSAPQQTALPRHHQQCHTWTRSQPRLPLINHKPKHRLPEPHLAHRMKLPNLLHQLPQPPMMNPQLHVAHLMLGVGRLKANGGRHTRMVCTTM